MASNNSAIRTRVTPKGGVKNNPKQTGKNLPNAVVSPATMALLQKNYGSRAAWINDPNLGPLLIQLVKEGITDPTRQMDYLTSHTVDPITGVISTVDPSQSWLGTHGTSAVAAMSEMRSNPGQYKTQINDITQASVLPELTRLGAKLSPDQINQVATDILTNGWGTNANLIDHAIQGAVNFDPTANVDAQGNSLGGAISQANTNIAKTFNDYGVPVPKDPNQLQAWVKEAIGPGGSISTNSSSLTGGADPVTDYAKSIAKQMYPWMSAAIDNGSTVKGYLQPFATTIANTLDLPSEQAINWQDPKWQGLIAKPDPTKPGLTVPQNLTDVLKTIKTDPQYGYDQTTAGKADAANFGESIKQMFGF